MISLRLNIHESLNDLISKDGNYIDLLTCDEYTLWYLLRHLAIQSFLPVIHTNCFLTKDSFADLNELSNLQLENFDQVLFNIEQFFNIKLLEYCAKKSTLNQFIKEGIGRNQLIYMRYDSYYDSLRGKTSKHYFHAIPIAGYDDMKGIYYSIFEGQHEVKYHDLENMYQEASKFFKQSCFYFDSEKIVFDTLPLASPLRCEIYNDLSLVARAWENEIAIFKDYQNQLDQVFAMNDSDKEQYVLEQRLVFHELIEGIHGNFIFRLNLISELAAIDTSHFKELFLNNRKKFNMIANMFRRASIYAKDDPTEFDKVMVRIKDTITEYCIVQSEEMLRMYFDILQKLETDWLKE